MNYTVHGDAGKIAGQLNSLGHLVDAIDPDLQSVFVRMVAKGITILSAPTEAAPEGVFADAAKHFLFKEAPPEVIFQELAFNGYQVVLEGEPST